MAFVSLLTIIVLLVIWWYSKKVSDNSRDGSRDKTSFFSLHWVPKVFTQPHIVQEPNRSVVSADIEAVVNDVESVTISEPEVSTQSEFPVASELPNLSKRERLFTPPAEKDDLKKIKGIGPVMENTLNELGVTSYKQLGSFTQNDIQKVSDALSDFPDRIERDGWVPQAITLFEKKYGQKLTS